MGNTSDSAVKGNQDDSVSSRFSSEVGRPPESASHREDQWWEKLLSVRLLGVAVKDLLQSNGFKLPIPNETK